MTFINELEVLKRIMNPETGELIVNDEALKYLEERYEPEVIPPCNVCGGSLNVASMSGGVTVYACSDRPFPKDETAKDPDNEYWQHYRKSKYTSRKHGDRFVVDLVRAYRKLQAQVNV